MSSAEICPETFAERQLDRFSGKHILRKLRGKKNAGIFYIRWWWHDGESQHDALVDKANAVLVLRGLFPVAKYIDAATPSPVRPLLWSVLHFWSKEYRLRQDGQMMRGKRSLTVRGTWEHPARLTTGNQGKGRQDCCHECTTFKLNHMVGMEMM